MYRRLAKRPPDTHGVNLLGRQAPDLRGFIDEPRLSRQDPAGSLAAVVSGAADLPAQRAHRAGRQFSHFGLPPRFTQPRAVVLEAPRARVEPRLDLGA